jgi:hypothetical protein
MTGTIADPATFAQVISSTRVIPGDTIIMRGGTYTGDWLVVVAGAAESPLTFRPYTGETVIIQGGLTLSGAYTEWQNITIQQPDPAKLPVYMIEPGTKLTDCDISGGFIGVEWYGSGTGSLIRCNIHNTVSYGIYTHNHNGGEREIIDCLFSNIGGYYDLHMYSDNNFVKDYLVSGCTFGKQVVVHAGAITNIRFLNNTFSGTQLKLGNGQTVEDPREFVVTGNTFNGNAGIRAWTCSNLNISGNIFAVQTENIGLIRGANEISLNIDQNQYTGGSFLLEGVVKSWQEWQAAGYDANGTYQ